MSLFRFVKYSSLLYLLGKHRDKLFRSVAILLFAFVSTLLYDDVRAYLEVQHPGTLVYALMAKIAIVYGSLAFVIWQFRPRSDKSGADEAGKTSDKAAMENDAAEAREPDRLDALADIDSHDRLRSRYDRILAGESTADQARSRSSTKSSRS